jgi:hypothetical protein
MAIQPGMIMSVVVALVILSVGVFAFFTTMEAIEGFNETEANDAYHNIQETSADVFGIIGVVFII